MERLNVGRWSELSVDRVFQEHEVMKEVDANETSGELVVVVYPLP